MARFGDPPEVDLSAIASDAVSWVIEQAVAEGLHVCELAQWSKALVAHMSGPLSPDLKQRTELAFPDLTFFRHPGSPHTQADCGYIDDGYSVSFPDQPRQT